MKRSPRLKINITPLVSGSEISKALDLRRKDKIQSEDKRAAI